MSFDAFLRKIVLENAVKYNGKANAKSLIGRIISEYPDKKSDMSELVNNVQKVVDQINKLSIEKQTAELETLGGPTKKETKSDTLKELTDAKQGNVVMRFAPSPSGPMHIGHALTGGLTSLYCKKYNGKFILRIEDTNPENIEPKAYEWLKRDADFVFGNVSEVIIQSDRMEIYYKHAHNFIADDHMYVCTCDPETFKELVTKNKSCPCRELKNQSERFEKMFSDFKPGEAVVRWKSDLAHPNPAMRDFPLFRINETTHPRQKNKYRVWPLMNFAVAIDDIELGMTHIIRAKDHADNAKRQELIHAALNKKSPITYFTGRIKFMDMDLSSTKTAQAIENGEYTSWDDIRLPFLEPLRRRGYTAESFISYAKDIGVSAVDKKVTKEDFFKKLNAFNKDVIDKQAKRFFLITDPVVLTISNLPAKAELDILPDKKGGRMFNIKNNIVIEKEDVSKLEQGVVRLLDLVNITQDSKIVSITYDDYKKEKKAGIIHWLPVDEEQLVDITVHMPDGAIIRAKAEKHIEQLQKGEICQFERFGFCRLDDELTFWYGHR